MNLKKLQQQDFYNAMLLVVVDEESWKPEVLMFSLILLEFFF